MSLDEILNIFCLCFPYYELRIQQWLFTISFYPVHSIVKHCFDTLYYMLVDLLLLL